MLIEDGENGFVLDELDVETWCSRIRFLLKDTDRLREIGSRAHEKVVGEYIWDVLADRLLEAYERKAVYKADGRF